MADGILCVRIELGSGSLKSPGLEKPEASPGAPAKPKLAAPTPKPAPEPEPKGGEEAL